jgi:hypothetical protein
MIRPTTSSDASSAVIAGRAIVAGRLLGGSMRAERLCWAAWPAPDDSICFPFTTRGVIAVE